jgi:hypothetical protein
MKPLLSGWRATTGQNLGFGRNIAGINNMTIQNSLKTLRTQRNICIGLMFLFIATTALLLAAWLDLVGKVNAM